MPVVAGKTAEAIITLKEPEKDKEPEEDKKPEEGKEPEKDKEPVDSTIEVELPGGEKVSYLISPDGSDQTIKYEKGNPIEFTIFVETNDDTSGSGQTKRTQLDASAHTIKWFVDGVLQEKENASTFTWKTEKVSSGLHEILCVIDGTYSVISKPIVAIGTAN